MEHELPILSGSSVSNLFLMIRAALISHLLPTRHSTLPESSLQLFPTHYRPSCFTISEIMTKNPSPHSPFPTTHIFKIFHIPHECQNSVNWSSQMMGKASLLEQQAVFITFSMLLPEELRRD